MVRIQKFVPGGPGTNVIEEIKALRTWATERWVSGIGLKEAKDLIEHAMERQARDPEIAITEHLDTLGLGDLMELRLRISNRIDKKSPKSGESGED